MGFDATKKRVIAARYGSLTNGMGERKTDRLAAHALSTVGEQRLGDILWRLKYGRESGRRLIYGDEGAVALLERKFRDENDRRRPRMLLAVIACALTEWVFDQCPKCGGRGKLGVGREIAVTKRTICAPCAGEGRVSYRAGEAYLLHGAILGNEIPAVQLERRCPACHGARGHTTTSMRYSRLRDCPTCHGFGRRQMDDRRRALEIGMPLRTWFKWKSRYLAVLRELRAADDELALRVDFRLERAENPDPEVVDPGVYEQESQTIPDPLPALMTGTHGG